MPAAAALPTVTFADGTRVPALGQGTWRMGDDAARAPAEAQALALGLDLGMTVVDTAEMYGDGGAERVVARALEGRRDEAFVISKVYPHNAGSKALVAACERSLARLRTDRIDLYLLHWRGPTPLAETVAGFEALRTAGKIVRWGVSNFARSDMEELAAVPGGANCAANQVLWHLRERGIEWDLVPWMRARRMPVIAYSPLAEGALARDRRLGTIAAAAGLSAAPLALAWLLAQPDTLVIPQSSRPAHVRANRAAAAVGLAAATRAQIDAAFPPPSGPSPLAVI
jgi:diketogulonate reductase-like aldo/keto reductase